MTCSYHGGTSANHLFNDRTPCDEDALVQPSFPFHPYQAQQYNSSAQPSLDVEAIVASTGAADASRQQRTLDDNIRQLHPSDTGLPPTYHITEEDHLTYQEVDSRPISLTDQTTSTVNVATADDEQDEYQLRKWVYETAHPNLTIGEILYQKSNCGDQSDAYQYQSTDIDITRQFDSPHWDSV